MFAFKVKDGPGGKEATWIVDVKNGKGSVTNDPGICHNRGAVKSSFFYLELSFSALCLMENALCSAVRMQNAVFITQ